MSDDVANSIIMTLGGLMMLAIFYLLADISARRGHSLWESAVYLVLGLVWMFVIVASAWNL